MVLDNTLRLITYAKILHHLIRIKADSMIITNDNESRGKE